MPHYVASDLVLHCLPMSNKIDARLIWVNFLLTLYSIMKPFVAFEISGI